MDQNLLFKYIYIFFIICWFVFVSVANNYELLESLVWTCASVPIIIFFKFCWNIISNLHAGINYIPFCRFFYIYCDSWYIWGEMDTHPHTYNLLMAGLIALVGFLSFHEADLKPYIQNSCMLHSKHADHFKSWLFLVVVFFPTHWMDEKKDKLQHKDIWD